MIVVKTNSIKISHSRDFIKLVNLEHVSREVEFTSQVQTEFILSLLSSKSTLLKDASLFEMGA